MTAEILLSAADPRVVLRCLDRTLAERICRDYLTERGWLVQMPHEWERPNDFCARLGIGSQTLIRKLKDRHRPPVAQHRGKTGRLVELAATKAFEEFCLRFKKGESEA